MAAESFFAGLKAERIEDWRAYIEHDFVRGIGDGTLPEPCFRRYLVQDYLFLIQFARAFALAAFKSETLADMRAATATLNAILDVELGLHVKFSAGWGLSEADLANAAEEPAMTSYTHYVLDKGMAGDLLDLHVALAPCIVGYAEIGRALAQQARITVAGNRYAEWIATYAGESYAAVANAEIAYLDRLAASRATAARFSALAASFRQATRLEARFWDMGLAGGFAAAL